MLKRIYISLCGFMLVCIIALTGCSGNVDRKENAVQGQAGGEENPTEEAGEEWKSISQGGSPGAGAIAGEVFAKLLEEAIPQYPKIAELSNEWINLVMYTEGCYCIYDGSYYGFMTEDGEEIAPYIYEQASPFSEGLACVSHEGKYGYIGKNGETALPFIYDQAAPFTDGLAYYRIGKEYGFIDHEGNRVLQPDCDSISSFHEGMAYFSVDGLYGYMDKAGEIIVEPVYEDAGYFFDGLAKVVQNGCYGLIGMDGEEVLPPEYDDVKVQDGYIIAEKDTLVYCFDREGKQCVKEGWDWIDVQGGLFRVMRDGWYGLLDGDGTVLLAPEYGWLQLIPERELVIVWKGGLCGVVDYEGNERIPCSWRQIDYDDGGTGGLRVECDRISEEGQENVYASRSYGYLSFTEEDDFIEIPPLYDSMSFFTGDRAVVGIDGKYGVIRRDGEIELPMEYSQSQVQLFENGSMALRTGRETKLYDSEGRVIYSGENVYIYACGSGYLVKEDKKYGLLNEKGEQILEAVYELVPMGHICGMNNTLNIKQFVQNGQNLLVRTGDEDGFSRLEIFQWEVSLQNHITPRVEEYMDFLQNGVIDKESGSPLYMSDFRTHRNFSKLYRMGEKEEPVLYFYSEPWPYSYFRRSDSGFFVFRNGRMETLAMGSESGDSARGDYICFWHDKTESRCRPGMYGIWEGFRDYTYSMDIYELQDKGMELAASCHSVSQTTRNYSMEELQENAGMFYDNANKPYTKESIMEAEEVRVYEVDGVQTTIEHYREFKSRYRYMNALDLHLY